MFLEEEKKCGGQGSHEQKSSRSSIRISRRLHN
jgi:hypothetical protein